MAGDLAKLASGALPELRQRGLRERILGSLSGLPLRLRRAERHHRKLCGACHDAPHLQQERPPFNLFQQSRQMPVREFAARMVLGIRGDKLTGLDNPFSDEELAGLVAYYRDSED